MIKRLSIFFFILLVADFLASNLIFKKTHFWNKEKFSKKYWRVLSPIYNHDLLPDIDVIEPWGGKYKKRLITNSLGFRDFSNKKVQKKGRRERILLIGDSFVEGAAYDYEHTIGGLLQNFYKKDFEVLNSGVSSYSPSIYYAKTKHFLSEGYQFDYAIIFLDVSDIYDEVYFENNFDGNVQHIDHKEKNFLKLAFYNFGYFLRDNFLLFRNLTILSEKTENLKNYTKLKYKASKKYKKNFFKTNKEDVMFYRMTHIDRGFWTYNKKKFELIKKGLDQSDEYLKKLFLLLNENNIESSLVIYPWPTQILYGDIRHEPYWKNFSKQNKINLINLYPYFEAENKRKFILDNFIFGDVHWNKSGNKKIFEALKKELVFERNNN